MIEGVGENIKQIVKTSSFKTQLSELKKILNKIKKDFENIKNKK